MPDAADQDGGYDLTALGWLLFEKLCAGWLEQVVGVDPDWWIGSADRHRHVVLETGIPGVADGLMPGPTLVATAWSRAVLYDRQTPVEGSLSEAWSTALRARERDAPIRSMLVLTDLPADEARRSMKKMAGVPTEGDDSVLVHLLGTSGLGAAIDEHPQLRLRHPYVLGVRRGGPALPEAPRQASTFDLEAAVALAGVFVPTGPYMRALSVLEAHGFCVLTGPPEMGKTAAARMIGLALMSSGWEVHECSRPEQVTDLLRSDRRQLFVADDAFGSTEYRPDAAERWARSLPEILQATDERHWLIWTSRPTPLKAGLRTLHRERGAERFPSPAQVQVDAADLERAEKALILLRHAKAAHLGSEALEIVRREGTRIVDHRHFTPERIRRFVVSRLPALAALSARPEDVVVAVAREIGNPTQAMAASYLALSDSQRAVLLGMLDCPPGVVPERELAAAARRQAPAGLDRAPSELLDRLTDNFLRTPTPTSVAWVHPSWRDLVIAQLAGDPEARRRFLSGCAQSGVMLALSTGGGAVGATRLPLLGTDADWDALGDRIAEIIREADERVLTELLGALHTALDSAARDLRERAELSSLSSLTLRLVTRARSPQEPVGVALLRAWWQLGKLLPENSCPPWLAAIIDQLRPQRAPDHHSPAELSRYDEWLTLVETLQELSPGGLDAHEDLGFPDEHAALAHELLQAARPLLSSESASPRAVHISRLLMRAYDLLGLEALEPGPQRACTAAVGRPAGEQRGSRAPRSRGHDGRAAGGAGARGPARLSHRGAGHGSGNG